MRLSNLTPAERKQFDELDSTLRLLSAMAPHHEVIAARLEKRRELHQLAERVDARIARENAEQLRQRRAMGGAR